MTDEIELNAKIAALKDELAKSNVPNPLGLDVTKFSAEQLESIGAIVSKNMSKRVDTPGGEGESVPVQFSDDTGTFFLSHERRMELVKNGSE